MDRPSTTPPSCCCRRRAPRPRSITDAVEAQTKAEVVVYTQALGRDDNTTEEADEHAAGPLDEWGVGRAGRGRARHPGRPRHHARPWPGPALRRSGVLDAHTCRRTERQAVSRARCCRCSRTSSSTRRCSVRSARSSNSDVRWRDRPSRPVNRRSPSPPRPTVPRTVEGQAVYDFAGIFRPDDDRPGRVDHRRHRGSAPAPRSPSTARSSTTASRPRRPRPAPARSSTSGASAGAASTTGWSIFFDLDPSLEHGQVQLYAAPGFEATFLDNAARQRIFDEDMVPYLRAADMDAALLVAMGKVDAGGDAGERRAAAARAPGQRGPGPDRRAGRAARLAGWAFFSWRRFGKDPVYLDDPSILMPAPPPDLTAASGAFVMDGGTSRRALTTAMLDLASRGLIAFREEKGLLGLSTKVGVDTEPTRGDAVEEAQRASATLAGRPARRRSRAAAAARPGRDRALHRAGRPAQVRRRRSTTSTERSRATSSSAAGWSSSRRRVIGAGSAKGIVAIVLGVVAEVHRGQRADLGAGARRWSRPSPAASSSACSPRACRR